MAKKMQKIKESGTRRNLQRPPLFESQEAQTHYQRIEHASSCDLATWLKSGAENEFAKLHLCESGILTARLLYKLKNWRELCSAGEYFMSSIDNTLTKAKPCSQKVLCQTNAGYVVELMGQGYVQLEEYQRAALCFESAIEINPHLQDGYLHWAELSQRLGMRELAGRIIAGGLKQIPSSPEMRMYQKAVINRPTISICMIVKNEEDFLEGCLTSVRDIADEIIVVDTGSEDRTVEIAESFGCKIFHQEWEGDFSKHRNYSLQQASSDWLFVIDADERVVEADIPKLKEFLHRTEYDLLSLTVYNVAERSGKDTTVLPSVRIFRRDLGLQYEGIVHNRLNFASDMKELRCPVGLLHHGYDLSPEKMKAKHERSMALLHKQIEQNSDNAFAHFNLAQLIRARGNLESEADCHDVITHARRVIELTEATSLEFGSIHLMACHQLATAYYALAEYEKGAQACISALKTDPTYLDCILMLAHLYRRLERYDEAAERYASYLKIQEKYSEHNLTNALILVSLNSRANAHYNLGAIAERGHNYSEALRQYQQAQKEQQDYLDSNTRIGWAHYQLEDSMSAQKYFRRDIELNPSWESAYHGLAETFEEAGDYSAAEATLRSALTSTDSSCGILRRYSDLLVGTSRANEALELLAKQGARIASSAELNAAKGAAELASGQFVEARESFLAAEKLGMKNSRVWTGLADSNLILEDNAEACKWFEQALADDPHSAHLLRNHAIALARVGELKAAVDRLAEYTPIAPDDRESRFIMGALLLRLERGAEALQVYEQLLLEDSGDEEALMALADCYLSLGGFQAAEVGFKRLLQINPNHAFAKARLKALAEKQSQLTS